MTEGANHKPLQNVGEFFSKDLESSLPFVTAFYIILYIKVNPFVSIVGIQ